MDKHMNELVAMGTSAAAIVDMPNGEYRVKKQRKRE
jgi:hypothetical protein